MSKVFRLTLALAASMALGFSADVAGTWKMSADAPDGVHKFDLVVKEAGGAYTARVQSDEMGGSLDMQEVAFKDGTLTFKLPYGGVGLIDFKLKVDADSLKGSFTTPQGDSGTVDGKRDKGAAPAAASGAGSVNVTGKWKLVAKAPGGGDIPATLELKQEGSKVSGEISTDAGEAPISDGKVEGSQFSFKIPRGDGTYEVTGTVTGSEYKGEYKGPSGGGTFTASKS